MEEEKNVRNLNYILVGTTSVGKTNLLLRFIYEKFEEESNETTYVYEYNKTIDLDGEKYNLKLWDASGHQRFRQLLNTYFTRYDCILFVYQIDKSSSFWDISSWLKQFETKAKKNDLKVLVGNKCDQEDLREVSIEEGRKYAKENKIEFFETSAKTGTNVNEVFMTCAKAISKKLKGEPYQFENDIIEMNETNELNETNETEESEKNEKPCCCWIT